MFTKTSLPRRFDLDWLRVLLTLGVLFFHSIRLYDLEDWTVKSDSTYLVVQIVVIFISRWLMPVMFVISGMAMFYALRPGKAGRFIKDRALRLLVPLVVGIFTHIALQGYLWHVNHEQYRGTFWQWYPSLFTGNLSWRGGHLWYLEMLFLFSLACLPLFAWLKHGSGQRLLARLDGRLAASAVLFLPVLPLILFSATLDPESGSLLASEEFGGWNPPSHLVFFLSGFLIASSQAAQAGIFRLRWASLAVGIVGFCAGAGTIFALTGGDSPFGSGPYLAWTVISSLTAWACTLALLGIGMQFLNTRTPALDYTNEAVLPFYVLHQSVLFGVAQLVLGWALPDLAQWAIILAVTLAIILALYEGLIRRIGVLRLLFGMKAQAARPRAELQQAEASPARS